MIEDEVYVMLMMMRADEGYTPNEKCSLEEMVACALADDTDACLAACTGNEEEEQDPEEVKAGTLKVTMTSEKGGDIPNWSSSLPVATYTLKATDEDINITSLVFEQKGYGSNSTITSAALYIDGQRVSKLPKDLDLNKKVTINLRSSYTIKVGKSVDVELRVATDVAPSTEQFSVDLVEVNSSAEKVSMPSNTTSNIFKLVGTDTASVAVTSTTALESPKAGTKDAELFEIKVSWDTDQDVDFSSITLVGNDKDLADYLKNLKLVLDGEVLAEANMKGKYLTFNLDKAYTIEKGKTAIFTVKWDVVGWASLTAYTFDLENPMDMVVVASSYDAPATVTWAPLTFAGITISAGRVVIERTNPTSTDFTKNRTNVYLGSFTVTNNAKTDLSMEDFKLTITDTPASTFATYIDTIKVRYGSQTAWLVELTPDAAKLNWTADDEQSISSKLTVYVYADIKDVAVNGNSFQMELSAIKVMDDDDNEVTDKSMPSKWLTMNWVASALNITKISLNDKSYSKGAEDIEAVSFKIKTNEVSWVKLKKLTFTNDKTLSSNEIRNASVFVGDEEYSATISAGTVKMTNSVVLDKNTTTTVKLVIDLWSNPAAAQNWFTYSLASYEAEDTTADKNDLSDPAVSWINWRKITWIDEGKLTASLENVDNNRYAKSILAWTSGVIAEYTLQAKHEDVKVWTVELTFANALSNVNDIELYYGDTLVASNPTISSTKATFSNINFVAGQDRTALTVKYITRPIDSDNGAEFENGNKITNVAFTSVVWKSTWNPITVSPVTTASKEFDVVAATIKVTKDASSTDSQTKLNLFVDKWSNETANGDPLKVYAIDLIANIISNNWWLASMTIAKDGVTLASVAADWIRTMNPSATINDFELNGGDNTVTITYVEAAWITNPSYSLELTNAKFVDNATWSADPTDVTTLLATTPAFYSRLDSNSIILK